MFQHANISTSIKKGLAKVFSHGYYPVQMIVRQPFNLKIVPNAHTKVTLKEQVDMILMHTQRM
jgi:hypothetical protein